MSDFRPLLEVEPPELLEPMELFVESGLPELLERPEGASKQLVPLANRSLG